MKIYYKIYSSKGAEGEQTELFQGKWSLIWYILFGMNKGVYKRRNTIEIKISKF